MKKSLFILPLALLSAELFQPAIAGGIAPGATRVIYETAEKQASLAVINSDSHERYLIQAWVEDASGQRTRDFIVTPPLFTASPKSENSLRIMYMGKPLPQDRETVFWMNIKAIPAVNKESIKDKNTLQLAVLSRIKLFMRPEGLSMGEMESAEKLSFHNNGKTLTAFNPTPYYQTLVNISLGGKKIKNTMVPPLGQLDIPLPADASGSLTFQTVNDYGAITPQRNGVFK